MKLKEPVNKNYCATVTTIKNIIPLDNCDNVVHTSIFGNLVVISKDTKIGDTGLFFPVETKLSQEFLTNNNLYRKQELNMDQTAKGYFEDNGRIKCVKFRQNKSMGLFMPLNSLSFIFRMKEFDGDPYPGDFLTDGMEFDELNGVKICEKYIPIIKNTSSTTPGKKGRNRIKRVSKLIENQFNFHVDTSQLGKNLHRVKPSSLISITSKLHGSSLISSKILCKKKLNPIEKLLKLIGIKIQDTHYDYVYSSRKVIKNEYDDKLTTGFYNEDIWGTAHNRLKEYLQDGMTFYAEIVGYLASGGYIQKGYDYGCQPGEFEVYIYRITYTNSSGKVFEFSARQVQDFCKMNGLKAVPELYYGVASKLFEWIEQGLSNKYDTTLSFEENFLNLLKEKYLEKDCRMCSVVIPDEGIVLRIEGMDLEVYKLKSFRFLELETKELDSGEVDIESSN